MFGSSLFALQARRRRAWFVLPLAIFLHLVAFASFVGAQYWSVAEVPEPDMAAVPVILRLPPPAAALPGGRPVARERRQALTPTPQRPISQPDPQQQAAEIPAPAPGVAEETSETGETGEGGPGIPGGTDPNGSLYGLPGVPPGGSDLLNVPAPAANDQPIHVGGAVLKPVPIPETRVQPRYTEAARRGHLSGVVILEAIIDAQGNVTAIRVVKPLPMGLDQEAVKAVRQWKFRPGTLHGKPVAVIFQLTVIFQAQ